MDELNHNPDFLLNAVCFSLNTQEVMRFESDGSIYVHGKFVKADKEIVEGVREFLKMSGCIKGTDVSPV